jgi:hypothetical protein
MVASTMTPREFVDKIIDAYRAARDSLHRHERVVRSENRSISPETEDLMAFYLAERFPQIDRIFICQSPRTARRSRRESGWGTGCLQELAHLGIVARRGISAPHTIYRNVRQNRSWVEGDKRTAPSKMGVRFASAP